MAEKNAPIGTVPCPFAGCSCTAKVYRFQQAPSGRRSMFTGRMYAVCETFGRYGADGKPASQEYLLEKSTIWGAKKPEGTAAAEPEKSAQKPAMKPAALPPGASDLVHREPAKPAVKPAASPAAKPAQPAQEPRKTGWGFF